ncbi:uncharacterized protein LOC117299194 [Asterias rubens]|uniref:uncharacterized protein LOC117299194 n=1 Tax=Asterias rubens TaxID=7604 RepID=UPI001455A5B6|nr:uncharacterized protein LOC117299194 [Asterias rubens]
MQSLMTTIKKLKEGAKKPYSVPLECVITSRSDVIRYKTGGISKTMLFVSLCDATGYIKGSVYDIHKFDDIEDGEGVYMKNYIMKSESCLVITSKTHVMERGKMSVPEELVRESVLLTRPATPPPIDVSLVKKSPVKSTVTVTGKISQDEAVRTVDVGGEDVDVRNVTLSDKNCSVRMALWKEQTRSDVHPGDYITATNCIVKDYQGELQLTCTPRTTIKKQEPPEEKHEMTIVAFIPGGIHMQVAIEGSDTFYNIDKDILATFLAVTQNELKSALKEAVPLKVTATVLNKTIIAVEEA